MVRGKTYEIPREARKDIAWWEKFIPTYNSQSILWYLNMESVDTVMATDSSLKGCGGCTGSEYYRARFPLHIEIMAQENIAILEMWAILIAIKIWKNQFRGLRFRIACDNMACVELIKKG